MTTGSAATGLALLGGAPLRSEPFPSWPVFGAEDEAAILEVLRSGSWFLGDRVAEIERRFPRFHQARHGVAVSSGTAALQVALEAAGVRLGDEVIVPSYTFVATAASVALVGAVPVFVDVDPRTYCIGQGRRGSGPDRAHPRRHRRPDRPASRPIWTPSAGSAVPADSA